MALTATDPVCDMLVETSVALTQEFDGHAYYFCEPACRDTFNDEPDRWARPDSEPERSVEATASTVAR